MKSLRRKYLDEEIAKGKRGMVRGYVVYSQWRAGCLGLDQAKDENIPEVGVAYTLWHRHDDDLDELDIEIELLMDCYRKMNGTEGFMIGYDWKDYIK